VATKRAEYVRGTRVRLLRDVTTRGERTFRAGVVLTLSAADTRTAWLTVVVRTRCFTLRLDKADYRRTCEVVWVPPPEDRVTGDD
jgi:predicted small integral membrane protein